MNKIAKGKRIEREVENLLKSWGYLTYKPSWSRWGTKDVFNQFDIVAIAGRDDKVIDCTGKYFDESELYPIVMFVQVKSNPSDFYKARKSIENWVENKTRIYNSKNTFVGVVLRKSKGVYRFWGYFDWGIYDFEVKIRGGDESGKEN